MASTAEWIILITPGDTQHLASSSRVIRLGEVDN